VETTPETVEQPKLFETVVTLASELNQGEPVPKPWPNFLPESFSLETKLVNAQDKEGRTFILQPAITDWLNGETNSLWAGVSWGSNALHAVAGLIDDPVEARQTPLEFDFTQTHLAIFGDSGSGKTSILRTIALSLAASHSPDELHLYVLDLGGRNFRALEDLPHMGAVIYADEEAYEERLNRLLTKLTRELSGRQKYISENDAATLIDYNAKTPENTLPAIIVLIDNLPELWENYTSLVESTLIPLVRRSQSVGISFVITANVQTNLPSKLYSLFGERITFRQTDPERYLDIVGRGAIDFGNIPGRGYIRSDRKALMFHASLPTGQINGDEEGGAQESGDIRLIAEQMKAHIAKTGYVRRTKPDPIPILPELTPLEKMIVESAPMLGSRTQAVLGQDNDLRPALFDLQRMGPHFIITGPPFSGKTTTLYNWIFSLAWRYSPKRIKMLLIDLQHRFVHYGGEQSLADLPHVLAVIDEIEDLEPIMERLTHECQLLAQDNNNDELYIFIDSFDDFSDELERKRALLQDLARLARRFGRDGLHIVIAGMLDGSANDFRRRIQSSNFGVGLRIADSLDKLRVGGKRPAGLYDRELPIGRGFMVKSGQATLIQIASPYEFKMPVQNTDIVSEEEAEARRAQALDNWVNEILERYPDRQAAAWTEFTDGNETDQATLDPQMVELLEIMRRIVYKRTDNNQDVAAWAHVEVLREAVKKAVADSNIKPEALISVLDDADTESVINMVNGWLSEIDGTDDDMKGDTH
jgi:DNA polymerase III delta prime subunit